jgi:hypothetical protein
MSGSEEVYGKVANVLVESLNVDEDEIIPRAGPKVTSAVPTSS